MDWQSGNWIDPGVASRRIEAKSSSVETLRPASILDLFPVPLRDCSLVLTSDWRDLCQLVTVQFLQLALRDVWRGRPAIGMWSVLHWIGQGLALNWRIGDGLADWRWIGGLAMDWQISLEFALDWQIGRVLALDWRICSGPVDDSGIDIGLVDWSRIDIGLAD